MPDKGIKPPNKRVVELKAELTFSITEKFEGEKILSKRYNEMNLYLIEKLAYCKALILEYQKVLNEAKR